jgi:hypothetical protein
LAPDRETGTRRLIAVARQAVLFGKKLSARGIARFDAVLPRMNDTYLGEWYALQDFCQFLGGKPGSVGIHEHAFAQLGRGQDFSPQAAPNF